MKKFKKLAIVSVFSFVLFFSILVLFHPDSALAANCPTTYAACLTTPVKCFTCTGNADMGCAYHRTDYPENCIDYVNCHTVCW